MSKNSFSKSELLLEQWKLASQLHRHEDDITWRRVQYFLALNGTLMTVVGVLWNNILSSNEDELIFITIAISLFGVLTCALWAFAQERARMYHFTWIQKAKECERLLLAEGETEPTLSLYSKQLEENNPDLPLRARLPVQKTVFAVAAILASLWFVSLIVAISFACNNL